jgi:RNA polymerase sigma-54 factor
MAYELKQGLSLRQTTALVMTPQLQQAIKLLQLSRLELQEMVSTELQENPVLEEGVNEEAEQHARRGRPKRRTAGRAVINRELSAVDKIGTLDWQEYLDTTVMPCTAR